MLDHNSLLFNCSGIHNFVFLRHNNYLLLLIKLNTHFQYNNPTIRTLDQQKNGFWLNIGM